MAFDVRKVAQLASLGLTPEEEQRLAREFADILEFVRQVRSLPLQGVPPAVHSVAPPLPVAADEPEPGLDQDGALAPAPASHEGFFQLPPILVTGADS